MSLFEEQLRTLANVLAVYKDTTPRDKRTANEAKLAHKLVEDIEKELRQRPRFKEQQPIHSETLFRQTINNRPPKPPQWFVKFCNEINQKDPIYSNIEPLNVWKNFTIQTWKVKTNKPLISKPQLIHHLAIPRSLPTQKPAQFITGKPHTIKGELVRIALPSEVAKGLKAALQRKDLFKWYMEGTKYVKWSSDAPRLQSKTLGNMLNPESSDKIVQHVLKINGIKKKFAVKQVSAQRLPYFTYEGQTTQKVENLGINTPHFHGYAEQNGATIAFFDHIDGHNLSDHNFTEEEVKKFAEHIAERHAKGVVQTDPYLRNTLIAKNGVFWMLDHEVTKLKSTSPSKKEESEFERLRKKEASHLSSEISGKHGKLFKKEYEAKLVELRSAA